MTSSIPTFKPYKGLVPFEEQDHSFFFGRDRDCQIIINNLRASSLTLLYGASGVGKSSVLQAGVMHKLLKASQENLKQTGSPSFGLVYFNSWSGNPLINLEIELQKSAFKLYSVQNERLDAAKDGDDPEVKASNQKFRERFFGRISAKNLIDLLEIWADYQGGTLLVILDQFEDYFLYHNKDSDVGKEFDQAFSEAVNRYDLNIHFLLSLREDTLAHLDRFKGRIPKLFDNFYRVQPINRGEARLAITKPIERYNQEANTRVILDDDLIEAVLDQVSQGQIKWGSEGKGIIEEKNNESKIETSYLQLVMKRLWNTRDGNSITREQLKQLGESEGIVRGHVDYIFEQRLTDDEKAIAAICFHYLITPSGSKIAQKVSDLAQFVSEEGAEYEITESNLKLQTKQLLEKLSDKDTSAHQDTSSLDGTRKKFRILRELDPPGEQEEVRYEIFHDVLAKAILEWKNTFSNEKEKENKIREIEEKEAKNLAEQIAEQERLRAEAEHLRAEESDRRAEAERLRAEELDRRAEAERLRAEESKRRQEAEQQRAEEAERRAEAEEKRVQVEAQKNLAEKKSNRKLRRLVGVLVFFVIIALVAIGVALDQQNFQEQQQRYLYNYTVALAQQTIPIDSRQAITLLKKQIPKLGTDGKYLTHDLRDFEWYYLHNLCPTEMPEVTIRESDGITAVAFSPDRKCIATGEEDKTLKLWERRTGQLVASLTGHEKEILSLEFSPDGKYLATGSADTTVKLWDVKAKQLITTFTGHSDTIWSVAFSPNGKYLAAGSADTTVKLWDIKAKQLITTFTGHSDTISSLAFSPDGKRLATGSRDKTVKLWDVRTRQFVAILQGHIEGVSSLAFSPDGMWLVSGSLDSTVKFWETKTGHVVATQKAHLFAVQLVVYSPDGMLLATAGGFDKTVKLWDVETREVVATLPGNSDGVCSMAFSQDGEHLVVCNGNGNLKSWNIGNSQPVISLSIHSEGVLSAAFSPDGKQLAVGIYKNSVKLCNIEKGLIVTEFNKHTDIVWSAVFSPDRKYLATGSWDRTVNLWDLGTGNAVATFTGHTGNIWSVAFSPDGKLLATGSGDNTVKLWDVGTRQIVNTLKGHTGTVWSVIFSPDGKQLATGSDDKTVKLWDIKTGQILATFGGHTEGVRSVAFSPDGKRLAGSVGNTVKLWNLEKYQVVDTLTGHTGYIWSVAFSPNGKRLATASSDQTVKLWDVGEGQLVATLRRHKDFVYSAAFSPDGKKLVTGGSDGTIKLWLTQQTPEEKKQIAQYLQEIEILEMAQAGNLVRVRYLTETLPTLVNWKNSTGDTPLHKAALSGNLDVVKYLVEHGAELEVKNNEGKTPFDMAQNVNQKEIASFLRPQNKRKP